ncbi:MAG: acyl-CoA dehydrogenase family protein, partial [Actinomycetota bacterium]|nr:acyl-CoA dehydrogenase family protein [Actinomycetota bacterium]
MNAEARLVAATEADEVEMAIADMAAEFFADRAPLERQHALARRIEADEVAVEPEFDLCREMGDLGFFFQAVPKSAGGLGLSTSVS